MQLWEVDKEVVVFFLSRMSSVSGKLYMHWERCASGGREALVSDEAQKWVALTPTAASL